MHLLSATLRAPLNKELQLPWHSAFRSKSGSVLASDVPPSDRSGYGRYVKPLRGARGGTETLDAVTGGPQTYGCSS